jgi:hypothetical protein
LVEVVEVVEVEVVEQFLLGLKDANSGTVVIEELREGSERLEVGSPMRERTGSPASILEDGVAVAMIVRNEAGATSCTTLRLSWPFIADNREVCLGEEEVFVIGLEQFVRFCQRQRTSGY